MENRRIPATLKEFHWHLINVNKYLHKTEPGITQMRGEILGMTLAELNTLHNIKMTWSSEDPLHPGVWDLHSQKDKKTEVTRQNVLQIMKEFSVFFRPLLVRMSASPNISNADRIALLIADPVSKRSRPTQSIAENCIAVVKIIGGGRIKIACHYSNDSNRACKPPRADALELAYRLFLTHQFSPTGEELPLMQLIGPNDKTTKIISTKASFIMEMGEDKMGYQMQFYARWINVKYPQLAGPWTGMWAVYIG